MRTRRVNSGEEQALFEVFYSAIHSIASRDYTETQINALAPSNLGVELWANRILGINPFVAEIEGKLVGYTDVQEN